MEDCAGGIDSEVTGASSTAVLTPALGASVIVSMLHEGEIGDTASTDGGGTFEVASAGAEVPCTGATSLRPPPKNLLDDDGEDEGAKIVLTIRDGWLSTGDAVDSLGMQSIDQL